MPEARGHRLLLVAPLLLGHPLLPAPPHPCSIGLRKAEPLVPRPRAYPPIYEGTQPNDVCGGREARVGVSPVCDQWSILDPSARGSYTPGGCKVWGLRIRVRNPLPRILASLADAPRAERQLTCGRIAGKYSRHLLEATTSITLRKGTQLRGWSRGKLGRHRSTPYYELLLHRERREKLVSRLVRSYGVTITISESERKAQMREARRLRERANRVHTNIKPHIHEVIEEMAAETKVTKQSMVRILLLEALEARDIDIDKVFRNWKARKNAVE